MELDFLAVKIYLWFLVIVFGACIGSFINVVIYRLPKRKFFESARSYCPACGAALNARDLIPVLSFAALKGRCRWCKTRISPRYPIIETICVMLAALCFKRFGLDLRTALAFCVAAILLAVAAIDAETTEIPDSLILALVPFALCQALLFSDLTLIQHAVGLIAVSLPMLIAALIIPGAFGGGDIKLMAVCGFLLGWKCLLLAFFIALITGGVYAIFLLVSRKKGRREHIAFGPYLCFGSFCAMLWGTGITDWYVSLLL